MKDEQPITLIGTTAANSTTTETYEFERDGTITGATVGTETGQEYGLRNSIRIVRDGGQTHLFNALGEDYIAGNGRDYQPTLRFEFEEGDQLVMEADNITTYDYHHAQTLQIDYETDLTGRIVNAIRRLL